jgi:hypothetical protein
MPDGDIIRELQRAYQKPYEALSEGKATKKRKYYDYQHSG